MSMFWSLDKQISKQNCMSLSNQIDSLLVTSSIRHSNHKQLHKQNSPKKQNKLNSDHLAKHSKRQSIQAQMQLFPLKKDNYLSSKQNTNKQDNNRYKTRNISNKHLQSDVKEPIMMQQCSHCNQELPIISQKLSHTINRLQQLQSILKLCFTKTMALESSVKDNNAFLIDVRMKLDENQNEIKNNQQTFIKTTANNKMQFSQINQLIDKLSLSLTHKNKQIKQLLQLSNIQLNQKVQKLSISHQQRFEALINMVQQLAKSHQPSKVNKSQQSNKLNSSNNNCFKNNMQSTKRDSLWMMDSAQQQATQQKHQHQLLPTSKNSYYHTQRRHQKARWESSKSKISYYLSKSNFNEGTTLCDTTITPLDYIK